ncbi:hypothetical protein P171DRAFT_444196 [Karstenula rhodostoma CBS 690.94]|uniref:BTB domain-containing protein n=1 Tax=Karstenula rhodostoma CBS 690.94 TaxID=1392251 RepID=A0A9P4UC39_9PLEO|nr:hypothetical protein P171DRAFT_444196 [Karstenula rhodostoma CBS 690.94]
MSQSLPPTIRDARVPETQRSREQASVLLSSVVTILVGPPEQNQTFFIHKDLIVRRAPFFRNALGSDWAESDQNTVKLPEDDPSTFFLYIQLLYTGTLSLKGADPEFTKLINLYILAEKLQDVETRNIVMDTLLATVFPPEGEGRTGYLPNLENVQLIFDGTPEGSPLREYVVDVYAHGVSHQRMQARSKHIENPPEFLLMLAVKLMKLRDAKSLPSRLCLVPVVSDPSKYHVKEPEQQDREQQDYTDTTPSEK